MLIHTSKESSVHHFTVDVTVCLNDHKACMPYHSTHSIIKTDLPCVSHSTQSQLHPFLETIYPLGPPTAHTHK